jgi:hypothetical protein
MRQVDHELPDLLAPVVAAGAKKAANGPKTGQRHKENRCHWQVASRVLEYQLTCAFEPNSLAVA